MKSTVIDVQLDSAVMLRESYWPMHRQAWSRHRGQTRTMGNHFFFFFWRWLGCVHSNEILSIAQTQFFFYIFDDFRSLQIRKKWPGNWPGVNFGRQLTGWISKLFQHATFIFHRPDSINYLASVRSWSVASCNFNERMWLTFPWTSSFTQAHVDLCAFCGYCLYHSVSTSCCCRVKK